MKKLLCLFMVIITVFAFKSSVVFADESLSFVVDNPANETLNDATVNTPYEDFVQVTGGKPPYTFAINSVYDFPSGISIDTNPVKGEDGKYYLRFHGTPLVGSTTYCNMKVTVTDVDGNTAEQLFTLKVVAVFANYKITSDTSFMYNGLQHTVMAKPYTIDEEGEEHDLSEYVKDYTITYGGKESQTNVGNYKISIRTNTSGYVTGTIDVTEMKITLNNTAAFSFGDTKTFNYDKAPHAPTISATAKMGEGYVETPITEYEVTYTSTDGGGYNAVTPPTDVGKYRVTCKLTDTNFSQPTNNSTTFEILPNTVDFELDNTSEFIYGSTWDRTYNPKPTISENYTVTYTKEGGTPLSTLTGADAGEYTVNIVFGDDSIYTVGAITPPTVTVKKKPVNFTVSDYTKVFTGDNLYPVISNDCMLSADQYTVEYFKIDDNTTPVDPTDVGQYTIVITLADDVVNYELGSVTPSVFTITEVTTPVPPEITLGDGNSIFVLFHASGGDAAVVEAAKAAFANDYTYNGKLYSANAWAADANLDMDEKALFVYHGQTVNLPSATATDKDGASVAVSAAIIVNGEERPLTGTTFTPDTPDLLLGVYTIKYTATDDNGSTATATRNAVVLWPIGDVNFDKNVNSIDGNYIKGNLTLAEGTANEKLFKYRVCDVNKDGAVTTVDMFAVYNRINEPLTEYYRIIMWLIDMMN